jgi:hypothetical protein
VIRCRIASSGAQLGPDKVAVWESEGLYTLAMLFGDTVNIMAQYGAGQVTPPIPLQPGVTAVFSQPADPAQGTLFVLLDDATLSVLSRDPAAGWSLVPVLQDNPTLQQLDGWRVQLAVTDANGAPVAGAVAMVTADRPAGTWQASGNTIIGPRSPAAFTADGLGRITFATPAVELDTAQLTVQVLRGGEPSGPPVTVSPDAGVHAFLAGTAPLNDLGALTPAALLAATSASNTPLCPVLTSLPADVQVGAAQAVISAITRCVKAGQGVTPGPADIKSFILDLSGVPKYSDSAEPAGIQAVQSLSGWWDSVQNDFDSFAHGLRHGAIKIATCVASWVEDEAGDGYHWAVSLAVTIGDDLVGTASYLITDMKSALHAVTGFFQKLGADIGDAISWLRHNVSELIKETGQNAAQVEQWLAQLPTTVSNQLTKYGDLAKDFFASLEATIDTATDGLLPRLEGLTFASPLPPAATRQLAGSVDTAALDIEKFLLGVQQNWLLDKIMSFSSGDSPAAQNPALQAALGQLAVALQDGLHFALDVGDLLWTGLKELFESRGSYDNTTFAQLFTILKAAVHDLLAFADAIVQALLNLAKAAMDQLGSMLSHQLNEIPLVGSLLQHLGVDATMSAAHLTSLVLMYPATLANRTKNGSGTPLFPAAGAIAAENVAAGQVDWAGGLLVSAAVGQFVWGVADAFADGDRARGEEPSGVIGWIDIVAPLILSILGWPGAPNADGTTAPPFANPIDSSGPDGGLIWPTWLIGFVPPIAGLCGQFADYQPADADDEEDWPEIGQYFTMVSAIAGIITGSIYNFQTGQSSNVQAAGILGNISNIIAPFATENLATETDGASAVIKLFVDAAGNLGAAIAMET